MRLATVALLSIVGVSEASGQDLWPVTLEVNAGVGTGRSPGEYRENRSGLTADVLLGVSPSSGWVVAADASMQGAGPVTSICIPSSTGGCVPSWPTFFSTAALLGYEGSRNPSYRVLIGPAYVSDESHTIGARARFDVGARLFWRVALAGSLRITIVPDYRGDRFTLYALGIGFRLR